MIGPIESWRTLINSTMGDVDSRGSYQIGGDLYWEHLFVGTNGNIRQAGEA